MGQRYSDLAIEVYEGLAQLPYFNPDIETPRSVVDFINKIEQADAVLICTPEYVFSLPGVLKNALEWTVATTVFLNKPIATIIAASSGQHAHESLSLIMHTFGAIFNEQATLVIRGAKSKLSPQGDVIDEQTLNNVDRLMKSLRTATNRSGATTNSQTL